MLSLFVALVVIYPKNRVVSRIDGYFIALLGCGKLGVVGFIHPRRKIHFSILPIVLVFRCHCVSLWTTATDAVCIFTVLWRYAIDGEREKKDDNQCRQNIHYCENRNIRRRLDEKDTGQGWKQSGFLLFVCVIFCAVFAFFFHLFSILYIFSMVDLSGRDSSPFGRKRR